LRRVHSSTSNWTNTVQEKKEFALEDLAHTETRELLQDVFRNPERLRPARTRKQVTEDAAKEFVTIAERLRLAGYAPDKVAHFLNRLVFCLFAEDVNLLPDDLFKRLLETLAKRRDELRDRSQKMLSELFSNMREGGEYGLEHILHFNGGLFDTDEALPLDADSFEILRDIGKQDWSAIDPSIFGTLFERFLDPDKRAQIGAHYTDAEKIMMIVEPVIVRPLTAEWEAVKGELADILSKGRAKDGRPGRAAINRAEIRLDEFLKRLAGMRVLDPACGSGNFLYMALQSLKDLEYRIIVEAETMGLARRVVHCGPENVRGIEINQYAAELARTTIWIGDIQWKRRNGFEAKEEPVLRPLEAIACRDALIEVEADGTITESRWPEADFIIGNPPFLGDREHNKKLGVDYTKNIRQLYAGRVAARADLVVYWFQKATELLIGNQVRSFGLVGTKSIAKRASRAPLDILASEERQLIFNAWTNEPWVVEGAAVRVSIVCALSLIAKAREHPSFFLNGQFVSHINPDLSTGTDVTRAQRLLENHDVAYQGVKLTGPFDILGKEARSVLLEPLNPNSRGNRDVIRRLFDIDDIVGRDSDRWVVDFGCDLTEREVALFQTPFSIIKSRVIPFRNDPQKCRSTEARLKKRYWKFQRPRPQLRKAISGLSRFIVTPESSEHRIFVFVPTNVLIQGSLFGISRDDYATFGILCSRLHEIWATAQGNRLGVGNQRRYNIGVSFETFPFPEGLTPDIPAKNYQADPRAIAIAKAAKRLDERRIAWLNPSDIIDLVPEVAPGYPDRILPKNEEAAAELRKRTLTNLYNQRPQWLGDTHRDLDAAVAAAYGWPADISEEDALAKLLELNISRAGTALKVENTVDDEDLVDAE
jgi:hypothetical protein